MSDIEIPEAVYAEAQLAANAEVYTGSEWNGPINAAVKAAAPLIVAAELRRIADNLRDEAGDRGNGWRANETYRAQKMFTQLRERAAELDPEGGER